MSEGTTADLLVLVDERGGVVGTADKLAAHQPPGTLHLAFSVFVSDARGRILLQQRAAVKYHFARRWSNSCCGHPRPGEEPLAAATRRLKEELGITVALRQTGEFLYRATDPASGLVEHELDHVFIGSYDGEPTPDPAEVSDWCWIAPAELEADVAARPDRYTPWLVQALSLAAAAAA